MRVIFDLKEQDEKDESVDFLVSNFWTPSQIDIDFKKNNYGKIKRVMK